MDIRWTLEEELIHSPPSSVLKGATCLKLYLSLQIQNHLARKV